MNVFLIDYENVHISGFDGLNRLKKKDKVYIFYSIKSENIYMDIMNTLLKNKVSFKMFKLNRIEKNALDFQLVLYLGTRLKKYGKKASFYIVSKDNGYQSAIDFAKEYFGIIIKKIESIEEAFIELKPPLLLLENNPVKEDLKKIPETVTIPKQLPEKSIITLEQNLIEQKRLKIDEKLNSNNEIKSKILDTQIKHISKIIAEGTINNQDDLSEHIRRNIGNKKVDLIPIILETCKEYLSFKLLDNHQNSTKVDLVTNTKNFKSLRKELILKKLNTNKKIYNTLSINQLNNLSTVLSDSTKNTKDIVSKTILNSVGKKNQDLVPTILECCKEFIR